MGKERNLDKISERPKEEWSGGYHIKKDGSYTPRKSDAEKWLEQRKKEEKEIQAILKRLGRK